MSDYVELERAIEELERMIDARRQGIIFISHDFRPVWEKARDIQAIFNNGVRFPKIEMREKTWERFRTLRDEASQVFQEQQNQIRGHSAERRNDILSEAKSAEYDALQDALFFFDRTTVDGMKVKARQLKEAYEMLSRYKGEMLGEHKRECHERLLEVRESHDRWWAQFKETTSERQGDRREKIETNLEKNREKLRNAEERLEKVRESVEENRSKLDETTSEKWIGIYTEWIEEGEAKIESIEGWINTLHEWIKEGEEQLGALEK